MATSIDSIVTNMRKGPVTLGWDVIVAFSRDKCNRMLALQYLSSIENQKPNIIKGGTIDDESNQYELSDFLLGIPLLSFENGSLSHSTATLTMPFISGRLDSYVKLDDEPRFLKSSALITEGAQYTLTVNITLKGGITGGSDKENIFIDLAETGLTFTTNFNESTKTNQVIGDWFKNKFTRAEMPFNRVNLGRLSSAADSPLNPRTFLLGTQPASSSSEGAIIAFIQTQSPITGQYPTDGGGFPLLIPDDRDAAGNPRFGSTLIIYNGAICRDFIQPAVARLPAATNTVVEKPSGKIFSQVSTSATLVGKKVETVWIQALNGSVPLIRLENTATTSGGTVVPLHSVTYKIENNGLYVSCDVSTNISISVDARRLSGASGGWEGLTRGDIIISFALAFNYSLTANPETLTLNLTKNGDPQVTMSIIDDTLIWDMAGNSSHSKSLTSEVQAAVKEPIKQLAVTFNKFELFPTANLIFPEQNAFNMISAYMPGDIVVFGQLDANRTSMQLSPLTQHVGIGQTCNFSAGSGNTASWKVLNIDGKTPGLGSISSNGIYTAPSAGKVTQAATSELIVATSGLKTAKALVTVMASSVSIDPVFYFNNIVGAKPLTLNAATLRSNDTVTWAISSNNAGGKVSGNNKNAVYTPPSSMSQSPYAVDVVSATTSNITSSCPILNFKKPSGMAGQISLLPAGDVLLSGSQQLVISVNTGDEASLYERIRNEVEFSGSIAELAGSGIDNQEGAPFTILYGGGTLTDISEEQATYTAPAIITTSCAIISMYLETDVAGGKKVKSYGYKILRFSPAA